jgi:hypothetical protein
MHPNRSLVAFTAYSSFAQAAVMGVQEFQNAIRRGELVGVFAFIIPGKVTGKVLIVLAPAKEAKEFTKRIYDRWDCGDI